MSDERLFGLLRMMSVHREKISKDKQGLLKGWLILYTWLLLPKSAFLWLLPLHGALSLWCRIVERVKYFVKVHLQCVVSNLKINKMLTLPPPGQISADARDSKSGQTCSTEEPLAKKQKHQW